MRAARQSAPRPTAGYFVFRRRCAYDEWMAERNMFEPPDADLGPAALGTLSEGTYEFGPVEDEVLEGVAAASSMWGIICFVVGAIGIFGAILVMLAGAPLAALILVPVIVVYLAVGQLYRTAGDAFKWVVSTEGDDIEHLMRALDRTARAFRIEFVLTALALALTLVRLFAL